MNDLPNGSNVKADRILEINPNHQIIKVLDSIKDDDEKLKDYSTVLLDQALILEGFKVENPNEFVQKMCKIMAEANNLQ